MPHTLTNHELAIAKAMSARIAIICEYYVKDMPPDVKKLEWAVTRAYFTGIQGTVHLLQSQDGMVTPAMVDHAVIFLSEKLGMKTISREVEMGQIGDPS